MVPLRWRYCFARTRNCWIGARLGSPLVVGYGDGETYLGSDALALCAADPEDRLSRRGRLGRHRCQGRAIFDRDNNPVERPVTVSRCLRCAHRQGQSRHFMKEIYEQPVVVAQTLRS